MNFDFDTVHKRIGSNSIKWDYAYQEGVLKLREACDGALASSTALPMWLSDMDFATAPAIVEALEKTRYNKTAAAKLLGLSFRQLRYRIKKLGIE